MSNKKIQVWECKVIIAEGGLPNGFDAPPRRAVIEAVEAEGFEVLGCRSGWGGSLTEGERVVFDEYQGPNSVYFAGAMDSDSDVKH